jgi:hypothetical protein
LSPLSDLLRDTREKLVPEERQAVVVFGSSAIVLRGISVGREINDLDLFVSNEAFENRVTISREI